MLCKWCGKPLEPGQRKCSFCGNRTESPSACGGFAGLASSLPPSSPAASTPAPAQPSAAVTPGGHRPPKRGRPLLLLAVLGGALVIVLALAWLLLCPRSGPGSTPLPSPSPTFSAPIVAPAATPSETPSAKPTPTPTVEPTAEPTPAEEPTDEPTPSPTPAATVKPSPKPAVTPSSTKKPSPTPITTPAPTTTPLPAQKPTTAPETPSTPEPPPATTPSPETPPSPVEEQAVNIENLKDELGKVSSELGMKVLPNTPELTTAWNKANAVRDNPAATQKQVDDALEALETAHENAKKASTNAPAS